MPRTGRPRTPPIDRFRSKTKAMESGCIEWTGSIDKYGYGQFGVGGRNGANVGAHRWSYEHHKGPIPSGFQIDHLCRNRKCVNPEHLEAVTPRENVMRSLNPAAINAQKIRCIRGHLLSEENTYTSQGKRNCKTCHNAASARNYQNRDKDAANARRRARRAAARKAS